MLLKGIMKRSAQRTAFLYLLFGATLYFLPDLCRLTTDGFSIARITSEFPFPCSWEDSGLISTDKEIDAILAQPFSYLGSGGQCFAFASQDGRYVIKFFKTRFIKFGALYFQTMPCFSKTTQQRKIDKALFKLRRDFNSYAIAAHDLKQETGILYVHLNKSAHLDKTLFITDKLGIGHHIDLDRFEFAIQRRAELAYPHIESLIKNHELEKAKQAMASLIHLSKMRCEKGIFDEDAKIERNFGFLDAQPIFIDIGRFVKDPSRKDPAIYQRDLALIARQMHTWITSYYPDLLSYFQEALQIDAL